MAYVDLPERPRRSFPQRLQYIWEHPHPRGMVRQIKQLLYGIKDAVDSAAIVAGPPPLTEEEAYWYNQARDRLPIASFQAVESLVPGSPRGAGGMLARKLDVPNAGSLTSHELPRPVPADRTFYPPSELHSTGTGPASTEHTPWIAAQPSIDAARWVAKYGQPYVGLLDQSRELDAGERALSEAQKSAQRELDPNVRQLFRVPSDAESGRGFEIEAGRKRLPWTRSPRLVPDQGLSPGESYRGGDEGNGGGSGGSGDDGDGERRENDYCYDLWEAELDRCNARAKRRPRWENANLCRERTQIRANQCRTNGGRPPPLGFPEWGIDDEDAIKRDKRRR